MNADLFGLSETTVEKIGSVLAKHPEVDSAILYGSRAKGNYKLGSDIDLTLVGSGLVYRDLLNIMDELDDLLLPYTIDLSILEMIDHAGLREHIERVGQEFYRRQNLDMPQAAQSS
ncbi:MAG: nucleotidyltransferase domain-containing protein [Akkermansiaceae bacterium]|jgi:predicted nucleotidyltransferase|nr:nucleotidyltransferase domain-containing protein [Akkermansiaceae bacterium]